MLNVVLSASMIVSLAILIFIGTYTLNRSESKKSIPFIAVLIAGFFIVLGYLMEINSSSAEGAFTAIKVLYIGSAFVSPLLLIFAGSYCDVKAGGAVAGALMIEPVFVTIMLWTTDFHNLYYVSYSMVFRTSFSYLYKDYGPLYYINHIYAFICLAAVIMILVGEYYRQEGMGRARLALLAIGACVCVAANVVYLLNPFNLHINYVPLAVVIFCVLICVNIMKYDMFDILPRATELALSSMREAFLIVDSNINYINANESAKNLFPSIRKLKKQNAMALADDFPDALKSIENYESRKAVAFSISDSVYYNANITAINTKRDYLLGYIILIQDITESVQFTKKLEEIAYTDALTGINNRRQFMDLTQAQFSRVKRLGIDAYIVIFDIDHFKKVNDSYGHVVGDKVLRGMADRVRGLIRPYDLFGRYGGEEFILFVTDIDGFDMVKYTERLRIALCSSPMVFDSLQLTVSASFGISRVLPEYNLEDAINMADEAMYRAKNEGRNRVVASYEY